MSDYGIQYVNTTNLHVMKPLLELLELASLGVQLILVLPGRVQPSEDAVAGAARAWWHDNAITKVARIPIICERNDWSGFVAFTNFLNTSS